ncbi:hypothetical protein BAY59_19735 [Prauserella coralliicola]|nr:hypothetical protein BAY59_19735 [Prauserella coralliicola]
MFGGGDVGVGLLDFVGEDVAEAEGLGDFGDAVVDEPGSVAVAQAVESQAALTRRRRTRNGGRVLVRADSSVWGPEIERAAVGFVQRTDGRGR